MLHVARNDLLLRCLPLRHHVVHGEAHAAQRNARGHGIVPAHVDEHHMVRLTAAPVDVLELSDGSMLISDDKAGVIYRLSYVSP